MGHSASRCLTLLQRLSHSSGLQEKKPHPSFLKLLLLVLLCNDRKANQSIIHPFLSLYLLPSLSASVRAPVFSLVLVSIMYAHILRPSSLRFLFVRISHFSHRCDKVPDGNNFREEGLI